MSRKFKLRPSPGEVDEVTTGGSRMIDRRDFIRHSFNSAAGVIAAASLGSIGFASLLMGTAETDGGDSAVRFWVPSGAEDTACYGDLHLEPMTKSVFEAEAANSSTGMAGAAGVWSGLPVTVIYVPHDENDGSAPVENKPRFQFGDGYDQSGAYIGYGGEMEDDATYSDLAIHNNMVIVFSRCPHLCCIPGWQLVPNDFTADTWFPGGTDSGGNKLFCICHSSRYDPTMIEKNQNRNRTNGTMFEYFGIKLTGGPAPVGMPLIPFEVNGDVIEALPTYLDWYTFCD